MASKKKPTKKPRKKLDVKDQKIKDLEAALASKQNEIDELVKVIDDLSGGQVSAPQYSPGQQLPPQYAPQPWPSYPYPPQPYYPQPGYPPYPYPPQPVPPQPTHPSLTPHSQHPGAQTPPVPGQPTVPNAAPVKKQLIEYKDKKGNTHREMVAVNNPHEDAEKIPRVNPDYTHGFLGSGKKGARGSCDHCGKPIDDPIHEPYAI